MDVFILIIFALAAGAYLLPLIIAMSRHHRNANAIAALNILTGWTFIGWVVAMVWSLTYQEPRGRTS